MARLKLLTTVIVIGSGCLALGLGLKYYPRSPTPDNSPDVIVTSAPLGKADQLRIVGRPPRPSLTSPITPDSPIQPVSVPRDPAEDKPSPGEANTLPINVPPGLAIPPESIAAAHARKGITILHFGDSHTAADYFTGEVRRVLQARFGDGGPGYVVAGRPKGEDVRNDAISVEASTGWSYSALQRSPEIQQFALSGFNSSATHTGETMTFSAAHPVAFDTIEVEVTLRPDGGAFDLKIDDTLYCHCSLVAEHEMRAVLRLTPHAEGTRPLRRMVITTTDDKPVTIAGVNISQQTGVTYSPIGFPGATVDIVNKMEPNLLTDELQRLQPQIVVLAFGTNEADNDEIDLAKYRAKYLSVIHRIRAALPNVRLVMIEPPDGDRLPDGCKGQGATAECRPTPPGPPQLGAAADKSCFWRAIPNLGVVRETQTSIAHDENIPVWNWADVTPPVCGAHAWSKMTPKLMSGDHVHFTTEGYRRGAEQFANFLLPILQTTTAAMNAVPNN